MNTDNVGQTEESYLDSNRLFPSNPTGVLTTLLQTQNFDNNTRTLLNMSIRSINNANASTRDDPTSNINGHKAVDTTGDINTTELSTMNNTPVNDDNSGNASGRDDQDYGGAPETLDVNEEGPVESMGNNSATEQPSRMTLLSIMLLLPMGMMVTMEIYLLSLLTIMFPPPMHQRGIIGTMVVCRKHQM
jgi:hypothetical protein